MEFFIIITLLLVGFGVITFQNRSKAQETDNSKNDELVQQIIELKSEFGRYKLVGQNADDFPKIPESNAENSFSIPSGVLSSSIAQTFFIR